MVDLSSLPRCRLPSGKEVSIVDVLRFFYDFNETDVLVLLKIFSSGSITLEELAKETHMSKASVSRSISKLHSLGFVSREKIIDKVSKGRPRYIYKVDREGALKRILENVEMCSNVAKSVFEKILLSKQ